MSGRPCWRWPPRNELAEEVTTFRGGVGAIHESPRRFVKMEFHVWRGPNPLVGLSPGGIAGGFSGRLDQRGEAVCRHGATRGQDKPGFSGLRHGRSNLVPDCRGGKIREF